MARPRTQPADRVAHQMRWPKELHDRLAVAAAERDVSVNWLVIRACEEFMDRLIPVEEIKWTR